LSHAYFSERSIVNEKLVHRSAASLCFLFITAGQGLTTMLLRRAARLAPRRFSTAAQARCAARLAPRRGTAAPARGSPRRLSDRPSAVPQMPDAPAKGWPWYLKALGASLAAAGTGAYIILLMHHEKGFRQFCDDSVPALVDLVRERYPFDNEDPIYRAYLKTLAVDLVTPRTVAFNGQRVAVDGGASASACREALGIACDLDIGVDDADGGPEVFVEEEAVTRPSPLEIAVGRGGASVWAPVPQLLVASQNGNASLIDDLEAQKRKIGDELASGKLRVDAAQPEIAALENRLAELRRK